MAAVALRASPTSLTLAARSLAIASRNYLHWSGLGASAIGGRPAGEGAVLASDGVANYARDRRIRVRAFSFWG